MNAIASLLSSRAGEAALFAWALVFTVVSLEILRVWIARGAGVTEARIVSALLALVFLGLVIGGIVDYALVGRPNFINLGFFLTGAAGLGILPSLLFGDKDRELRRMAAHDL
jgi:hypothetical protein